MATQDHIHLDGTEYTVLAHGYLPSINKYERATLTAGGVHDIVFPPTKEQAWDLILKLSYSQLSSLMTTWEKTSTVAFTDPLNNAYTVVCVGPIQWRNLIPILDGDNAIYHVPCRLLEKNV